MENPKNSKNEEDKLRDIRAELELRVRVRTAELTRLNEELRKETNERMETQADTLQARQYGDWKEKKCFEYFMDRRNPCPGCAIDEALKTKKAVASEKVLPKEGMRPVQVITIPFQDEKGAWLLAEVSVDISQKKKIEEELQRYRNHLEQLVEERTQDLLQETIRYRNSEFEKSRLNRQLLKTNEKLKSISLIDAHTGLYNYRYLQDAVEVEFNQARRYAQNLALIMLDVDYFKSINDVLGFSVISFPEDRVKSGIDLVNLANRVLNRVKDSGGNRVFSALDIKSQLKKGIEKISKAAGVKTLKNTISKLNKQSKQGLSESIFAFAKTLELKDHYTCDHVENTVHFATEIAKELNLAKEDIELIKQASIFYMP